MGKMVIILTITIVIIIITEHGNIKKAIYNDGIHIGDE